MSAPRHHPLRLPERLLFFFVANPDEQLAIEDVANKTGANLKDVYAAVRELREAGWISKTRGSCVELTAEAAALLRAPLAPYVGDDEEL